MRTFTTSDTTARLVDAIRVINKARGMIIHEIEEVHSRYLSTFTTEQYTQRVCELTEKLIAELSGKVVSGLQSKENDNE